jgi:hypothetical protein
LRTLSAHRARVLPGLVRKKKSYDEKKGTRRKKITHLFLLP